MRRGMGKWERALLKRARRDGYTPVLPDDVGAFSSTASSIRRAARSLERKGLIKLSIGPRNRHATARRPGALVWVNTLHMEPVPWTDSERSRWRYRTEPIRFDEEF